MISTLKEKMDRVLYTPAFSFLCLILAVIIEETTLKTDAKWLSALELALGILGLISALNALSGKWMRRAVAGLLAFVILSSGINLFHKSEPAAAKAGSTSAAESTSQGTRGSTNYNRRYTGSYYGGYIGGSSATSSSSDSSKFCNFCSGTGNCHLCYGQGTQRCGCMDGKCRSCNGSGIYFSRTCLVCSGDGYCNTCNGMGRTRCTWCGATGKCSHCNGRGSK